LRAGPALLREMGPATREVVDGEAGGRTGWAKGWKNDGMFALSPMLVGSGPLPTSQEKYAFEVKWDGFRALITPDRGSVSITSRNGHDMTSRYGELRTLHDAMVKPQETR
jgi:ATP-dependent DNA ligase